MAGTSEVRWEDLDAQQKEFCDAKGDIRLLAPAGCGKTQTLLWRCQRTAQREPDARFLLVTFTRAACGELQGRLESSASLKHLTKHVTITTLNGWGWNRLRRSRQNARLVCGPQATHSYVQNSLQPVWEQYPPLRALMRNSRHRTTASKSVAQLLDAFKSLGFTHEMEHGAFAKHLQWLMDHGMPRHLTTTYERLVDLEIVNPSGTDPTDAIFENFFRFWCHATIHLHGMSLFTLEDQKYWSERQLADELVQGRRNAPTPRFRYLLVDEFQDINPLDLRLVDAIARWHRAELTLVGDEDQAIFEWRGATPHFILKPSVHFDRRFGEHVLRRNYRSPSNIVRISSQLIGHNRRRVAKTIEPVVRREATIEIRRVSGVDASMAVVEELLEEVSPSSPRQLALVARKRAQLIPYQILFTSQGIAFTAAEDLQVMLSAAFQELEAMLATHARASLGSVAGADPVIDILQLCDKVLRYKLSKDDRSALATFLRRQRPKSVSQAILALREYSGPLKGDNRDGARSIRFAQALDEFLATRTVAEALAAVSENFAGLKRDYGKSQEDIFYADPPFLYLQDYAERYKDDFAGFLDDIRDAVSQLARTDEGDQEGDEWKQPVHLLTALRAKGKEFDTVVVLDAVDGVWPSRLAEDDDALEAERRLFYVAVTRARKRLVFLVSDHVGGETARPSPYLGEMGLLPH